MPTILEYNEKQTSEEKQICEALMREINLHLPIAESKVWHAHPVWFLDGNPVVGYNKLKDGIRLLFWSGQSFEVGGLQKTGSFKAAEKWYKSVSEIDNEQLAIWLKCAIIIQWDYKNIVKRKGILERLK